MAEKDELMIGAEKFSEVSLYHPIAPIYFYSVLDCLVDQARCIAKDFIYRPHLYVSLPNAGGPSIPNILGQLYAQYGTEVVALGKQQRNAIFRPLFGSSTTRPNRAEQGFARLSLDLIDASTAFAERVFDTGEDMLRERVRTTHRPLRQYLDKLNGDSVRWARDLALTPLTQACYEVLRNPGIAAIFGVSKPPAAEWPFIEDADGDLLVEQIAKQISRDLCDQAEEDWFHSLTRERFSNLQRAALRGFEALEAILTYKERSGDAADVDKLIRACYTWGAALKALR